jgi:c-di-AMP phosphodiesterase-like protein
MGFYRDLGYTVLYCPSNLYYQKAFSYYLILSFRFQMICNLSTSNYSQRFLSCFKNFVVVLFFLCKLYFFMICARYNSAEMAYTKKSFSYFLRSIVIQNPVEATTSLEDFQWFDPETVIEI